MKRLIAAALIVSLTGCTSMRVVADGQYKVGDEVQIVTKDGQKRQVVLATVDSTSLNGIPRAEIERVEQKEVSVLKTGGAIYAGVAVLALLAVRSLFKDIDKIGKK